MDNEMIQLSRFLDACQEVEQNAADLYHLLADQFRPDTRVARLWRKTALEEENHAREVKLARIMVLDIAGINLDSWRSISRMKDEKKAANDLFVAMMKEDRCHVEELRVEMEKQQASRQPVLMAG